MRETTWTLRGMRFAAIEWGVRTEDADPTPPTIFLHGFLDHAGAWRRVAERLTGWRIALDQRGHGRSAWAAPGHGYFFPEYLADLDALVAQIGRPVRLVGHSMGGTVSTQYAGARPESVTRLVSVDGLGLYDQVGEVATRARAFLEGQRAPPKPRVYPSLDACVARLVAAHAGLDAEYARELAERGTTPCEGGVTWSYDPRHRSRGALPYRHSHHLPLLAGIRCPVLVVHPGEPVFAPADVALLEAAIADLRAVTIPGTGHMIHLQQPAVLAAAIDAFFGEDPPGPP